VEAHAIASCHRVATTTLVRSLIWPYNSSIKHARAFKPVEQTKGKLKEPKRQQNIKGKKKTFSFFTREKGLSLNSSKI
jgi:hypothetical protein